MGHVISDEGIAMDLERVEDFMEWPAPMDVPEVRSFMVLEGYYQWFIEAFLKIANTITELKKKNEKFVCTEQCVEEF